VAKANEERASLIMAFATGEHVEAPVKDGRTECGVSFDDGTSEILAVEFIRSFAAGKRVEARYNREDDWYSGTITGRRTDGLFIVEACRLALPCLV
jgi:hypothetical protein